MKSHRSLLVLTLALLSFAVSARDAQAAIRIYRISSVSRALLVPQTSISVAGYLIYDTAAPGNSQTVEVRKNKTYVVNGRLSGVILPGAINFRTLDLNRDTFVDTEFALIGFQGSGVTYAGAYGGPIPRNGFIINNTTFFQTAKGLRGGGTTTVNTQNQFEYFTQGQSLVIDALTASNPAPMNTTQGTSLVTARLTGFGYTAVAQ